MPLLVPGVGVILVLAVGLVVVRRLRRGFVDVRVVGSSMEPTFRHGDRVLARRVRSDRISVNDVVVIERPRADGSWNGPPIGVPLPGHSWIIKRVVAVAGDPVPPEVKDAVGGDTTVPAGSVVVRGDAPGRGLDSRYIGYVPIDRILGIAMRTLES